MNRHSSPMTGLTITAAREGTVLAVDALTLELLRYGKDAALFFAARDADPDSPVANALCAALHLFAMTREGIAKAHPYLRAASRHAPHATEREWMFVEAVQLWAMGDTAAAVAIHRDILRRWPRDLLSLKLATYHQLNRGDFAGMLATVRAALPANRTRHFVHGIHAFALGQNGRYREAETAARRAADLGFDPWAEHALAHVFELADASAQGLAWLAPRAAAWDQCSSFLYTHNWWHVALLHLAEGDPAGGLAVFDDHVWARRPDSCQDQVNAIALLARLELAGVDVCARWQSVAAQVARRQGDHLNGFMDLHYVLALARSGRDEALSDFLGGLADWALGEGRMEPQVAATLGNAAWGIAAYGAGDHARAARLLKPCRVDLARLGGSDVQRELFDLILVDALRHGGRPGEAAKVDALRRTPRARAAWERRAVAATCAA